MKINLFLYLICTLYISQSNANDQTKKLNEDDAFQNLVCLNLSDEIYNTSKVGEWKEVIKKHEESSTEIGFFSSELSRISSFYSAGMVDGVAPKSNSNEQRFSALKSLYIRLSCMTWVS